MLNIKIKNLKFSLKTKKLNNSKNFFEATMWKRKQKYEEKIPKCILGIQVFKVVGGCHCCGTTVICCCT
jgi:hypothetical protein